MTEQITDTQLNELLAIAQQIAESSIDTSFETKEDYEQVCKEQETIFQQLRDLKAIISTQTFETAKAITINFVSQFSE